MKWVALGALALVCGASVCYNEPWIQAPAPPAKVLLNGQEIRNGIRYEENLKAAKEVLAQRRCDGDISRLVTRAAMANRIPVRIVAADIVVESGCNASAKSKAGALGLMQVMPKLNHVSSKLLWNPETNVEIGTRILANKIHRYGYHGGLARYFGISQGSDAGEHYAAKVLAVAYQR